MTYDHWKTTNPADEFLGPEPDDEELYHGQAPCPHCFESSGYMERVHPATWYEPAWADSDPTRPCPHCNATGAVDCPLATLDDLEDLAAEEAEADLAFIGDRT